MMQRFSLILMALLLLVTPAKAGTPLDYTSTILEQARSIVASNRSHNEKLADLSVLFGKFLDTDSMGREALGQHWSSFTPEHRRNSLPSSASFSSEHMYRRCFCFRILTSSMPGNSSSVTARSQIPIVTPRDQFDVTYRFIPAADNSRAISITIEEVNLTANLGNQFNLVLARMTVDDLLTLMRRKYGNLGET
jgi:hypothetical protein